MAGEEQTEDAALKLQVFFQSPQKALHRQATLTILLSSGTAL